LSAEGLSALAFDKGSQLAKISVRQLIPAAPAKAHGGFRVSGLAQPMQCEGLVGCGMARSAADAEAMAGAGASAGKRCVGALEMDRF